MRFLVFVFSVFVILPVFSQDSTFQKGNQAFSAGDYTTALNEYNKLVGAEKISGPLFYNLGNTYYKLEEIGEAIWAYEKALKINPGNENVLINHAKANGETVDQLERNDVGIGNWLAINFFNFPINFWSYVSIFISILLALFFFLYRTTKKQRTKNISLSASLIISVLLVSTILISSRHKSAILDRTHVVIISEYADVKTAPSEAAPTSFQIFEGTKVSIKRSNESWIEIGLNGNTGWIEKSAAWEI